MPDLATIPPEVLDYFRKQGYSDAEIEAQAQQQQPEQPQGHSLLGTVGTTAIAHAGGYAGGGAGFLGTTALLAPWLAGPEAGIPADIALGAAGIGGGLVGGLLGQKAQDAITPQLEQEAAEAAQENPKTALATDIALGALGSGFRPSADALRGIRGLIGRSGSTEQAAIDSTALKSTALNSILNPAINSGISYATTGQLPSGSDLASQAIGGAVFSHQMDWAHNLIGAKGAPQVSDEPLSEPNNQTKQTDNPDVPLQLPDKRRFFGDESGIIDIDGQVVDNSEPNPEVTNSPKLLPFKASPSESGGNLTVSPQILQTVIDKGATQPVSVQRIFPKLNLSNNDAAEVLRQANEMQSQQSGQSVIPAAKTSDILPPNTTTDERATTPLPSVGNEVPPVVKPNPPMTDPMSGGQKVVNSPLRYGDQGTYGHWIAPDGTATPINLGEISHEKKGISLIQKLVKQGKISQKEYDALNIPLNSSSEINRTLQDRGYLRGVRYGQDQYYSNGNRGQLPTPKQKSFLKNYGIENNLDVTHLAAEGEFNNKLTINSPLSDYNRYQELTSQLAKSNSDKTIDPAPIYKEMKEITDRNGGNPPKAFPENHVLNPVVLQAHIMSGRATTGSVLEHLANTPNHPMQELASELLNISDTKSLGVKWNHDSSLDKGNVQRSNYDPKDDVVNIGTGSAGDSRVVLEEASHSMTSKKIPHFAGQGAEHYNRLNTYLKTGSNPHVKDLIQSYFDTAKELGIHDQLFGGAKGTKQLYGDQWPHKFIDIKTQKSYPEYSHDTKQEMLDFHRWLKSKDIPIESSHDGGTLGNRSTRLTNESLDKLKTQGLAEQNGRIKYNENIETSKRGVAGNPDAATKSLQGFGHTTKYAMGNLDEFIAQALKDPQFQRVLDGIKTTDGRTVMQKIVDAVRKLLGLSPKAGSMLDRVLRSSGELIKQDREGYASRLGGPTPEEAIRDRDKQFAPPKEQTGKSDEVSSETKVPFGKLGRTFQNALDRARTIAPKVADAFHRQLNERQQIDGDVYGKVKNVMQETKFSTSDGHRLMDAMRQEELTHNEVPMSFFKNQAQKQTWNEYKKVYKEQGEARIKDAQPVIDAHTGQPRMLRLNPTAHPLMLNPKVGEILKQNTNTEAIKKLHDDFIADQMQRKPDGKNFITNEEAEENYLTHVRAIQGRMSQGDTGNLNHFKANRQAEGIPLPKSWTRSDFEDNLKAFSARNAADRSFYRNIEKNPEVMAQLGETKDAWNQKIPRTSDPLVAKNDAVHALLEGSHGEVGGTEFHNTKALEGLFTASTIASPALAGVHIPIANVVAGIGSSPNPITTGRGIVNALTGITSGLRIARENGIRIGAGNAARVWDSNASTAERIQGLAAIVRKISTFNDLITKGTIGFTQTFMRTIVDSRLERANYQGDRTSQSWLKKLDPDYKIGKDYTDKELDQLATRAVGYIHGTSDARTMPPWMLHDSEVSGFFSLAHWSVGQTDRFMKDVYTPATRGDLTPLITNLFGAAVGGYIIKELREEIAGKKSPIPSLSEIASSDRGLKGNAGPLAYNMIAAMQYSGFGGMFSQIAKYPFDAIYKNIPQGATFPLDETISDVASTLHQVSSAIANDPNINWVDLSKAVSTHLITSNFRLGREAYNFGINSGIVTGTLAEKKMLSDKLGQLRRFEQVEGLPYDDQAESASNPYLNLEQKKFKAEQDLPTAMKELPGLVSNIIDTYKGNPDVMMSKLKALKENQYSTFPSMDTAPLSFYKYLGYLQREEGPQAAQDELMQYMQHKVVNEVKSSVVP